MFNQVVFCCNEDKPVPLIKPDIPGGSSSQPHSMKLKTPMTVSKQWQVTSPLVYFQRVCCALPDLITLGWQHDYSLILFFFFIQLFIIININLLSCGTG